MNCSHCALDKLFCLPVFTERVLMKVLLRNSKRYFFFTLCGTEWKIDSVFSHYLDKSLLLSIGL